MREDWVECKLSELVSVKGVFKDGDWVEKKDQDINGEVRLIQLSDIGDGFFKDKSSKNVTLEWAKKNNCTFLIKGDILIARMPDPLGRATLFPLIGNQKYITAVDVAILRPENTNVNRGFLEYQINNPNVRNEIDKLKTGTTRKRISRKNLNKVVFQLPPLPEQRAIVAKIEELFSSLDKGIADLKKAQEQLKVYRQSVLKKAFEGLNEFKQIKECGEWKGGGTPSRRESKYWDNGKIPWVSSRDVKTKEIHDTERHITELAIPNSSTKWIEKESLLFVMRSGILRRIFPIAIAKTKLCVNQDIQTVFLNSKWYPEYVYWFLKGNETNIRHTCSKDGTTVESIDANSLKAYLIPICTLKEQHQIVKEIESHLSVCDAVEKNIEDSLEKANSLRQSILKKAFEGTLLTEEEIAECKSAPDYEPASVLLEKIKKEKESNGG